MPSPSNASYEIVRGIGRWDLVALMVNITIGSGILGLPAKLFALTGVYSVLALVLCAALVAVVAICFAEVGSRFTHTGGPYLFTRTSFGATPGFIVGWLYWVTRVLTFATICNLLVVYFARVVPVPRALIVSLVVLAILLVNLLGIRQATIVSNGLTLLKVSLLFVFGAVVVAIAGMPGVCGIEQVQLGRASRRSAMGRGHVQRLAERRNRLDVRRFL